MVDKTLQYIGNQHEHHKVRSFADEYIEFLRLYNVKYDEKYVLDD